MEAKYLSNKKLTRLHYPTGSEGLLDSELLILSKVSVSMFNRTQKLIQNVIYEIKDMKWLILAPLGIAGVILAFGIIIAISGLVILFIANGVSNIFDTIFPFIPYEDWLQINWLSNLSVIIAIIYLITKNISFNSDD